MPQNTTFVSSNPSQSCGVTNGIFSCNLGSLALNATAQITLVLTSSAAGTLSNSSSVTATEADPNTANNAASTSVTVNAPPAPKADLNLTASATPNPVVTGANLTYTFSVNNAGPDAASSVTLGDVLPANTSYVSSNASQGLCGVTGGKLTCNLGNLALNGSAQVTLVLTSSTVGTLSNSATASATETDPNTANNTASATVNVQAPTVLKANLGLTLSATPNPVQTGQNLTYTFTVSNAGPDDANGVNLTDPIPQNASYVSSSTTQGLCSNNAGTFGCALGVIKANASVQVTLVISSSVAGTLSNTASVSATETDPDTANNSASASVTIQAPPSANLGLTMTATPNPVVIGKNLSYTITVTNAGPDAATNTQLSDTLPANTSYVSSNFSVGSCTFATAKLSCGLGTLAVNATAQVTLVLTSSATGTLTNTASVSATESDPVTTNNSASTSVVVQAPPAPTANLGLTISATPNPVVTGANLTYTMTITNAGPDPASNIQLTNTLPANTTHVSSSASQGSCNFATGTLTCPLGTLAANANAQVTLVLTSSVAGTLANTASVSATELDPVTTNNTSSLNVTVQNPIIPGSINLPPTGKISWDWQIGASGDSNVVVPSGAVLMDVDGFNISAAKIASLKAQGIYTVCYLDVGSWEPGRPDSDQYPAYLKIFYDSQWAEWFLDINDVWKPNSVLATILRNRFKMCADKGFDSIEPDNLQNDENVTTGVITTQNQIDFNGWVADNAHAYNLAVFQKNGPDKILLKDKTGKMMVDKFDAILNEECQQYTECAPLAEYVKRGKLALNVEYTQTLDCALSNSIVMNSIKKDLSLTGGNMSGYQRQTCP